MLVISIFIIIVIAVLAASLSKILSSSADSVATEVYSSKAYYAAESGMESAIYRVLRIKSLDCKRFPAEEGLTFDVSGIKGLENCKVSMTCQEIVIDADNSQFYLTSTAVCETDNMLSQHSIEAEIK